MNHIADPEYVEDNLRCRQAGKQAGAHQVETITFSSNRVETFKHFFEGKLETGECGVFITENLEDFVEVVFAHSRKLFV